MVSSRWDMTGLRIVLRHKSTYMSHIPLRARLVSSLAMDSDVVGDREWAVGQAE